MCKHFDSCPILKRKDNDTKMKKREEDSPVFLYNNSMLLPLGKRLRLYNFAFSTINIRLCRVSLLVGLPDLARTSRLSKFSLLAASKSAIMALIQFLNLFVSIPPMIDLYSSI